MPMFIAKLLRGVAKVELNYMTIHRWIEGMAGSDQVVKALGRKDKWDFVY